MHHHIGLGKNLLSRKAALRQLIISRQITLGGYKKGKIYGRLDCSFGKRMNIENRVFFESEEEALKEGYRPCGHCMPQKYKVWKALQRNTS